METKDKIFGVLNAHRDKDFVKRMLFKDKSPVMYDLDGREVTHLMSGQTDDKGVHWYPTVVRKKGEKKLTTLSEDEAYDYAMKTGEYITFENMDDFNFVAGNYKAIWGSKYWTK